MKDHDYTNDPKLPFESRTPAQSHSKFSSKEIHQQRAHNAPKKQENRYIEEDIFDGLSGAFSRGVAGVKATFDRMIDHSKAFLAAMGVQIATFFVPSKIDLTMGFTFLTTYLGFIMLFPSRPNRFALGVGIIAGLLMILSGLWPLAAIIAGLVAAISGIRDSNIPNKAFWFTIPFSLLLIIGSVAWNDQSIWGIIPTFTLAGLSVTTLFGLFAPKNIRRKFSYFFMSESEKLAYQEEEKEIQAALKALEEANLLKAQKAQKYALFGRHIELLEKIEVQVTKLPDDLADQVVEIGISSVNIIKSMESDPRDVLIGGRFLNRYLPIIHENLTKYITVAQYAPVETKEELHKDILKSVNTLQQAFEQLAFELVENDLHDLKIDMNVIDTLVRSQGFEVKK
ncbi:5-bromo-4-chloroindolyl phosphate hydrolysis family protein [Ignatzschineria sp. LJL83]